MAASLSWETINTVLVALLTLSLAVNVAIMLIIFPTDRLRVATTVREFTFLLVMANTLLVILWGVGAIDTPVRTITFGSAVAASVVLTIVASSQYISRVREAWQRIRRRRDPS